MVTLAAHARRELTRALKCKPSAQYCSCLCTACLLVSLHSFGSLSQHPHPFVAWLFSCSQDIHTFSLSGTTALHCGHTLLGGSLASETTRRPDVFSLWPIIPRILRMRINAHARNGRGVKMAHSRTMMETLLLCNGEFSEGFVRTCPSTWPASYVVLFLG